MWSCNKYKDDVAEPKMVSHRLSLNMPLNINGATLSEGTAVLTNIQTGRKYTAESFRSMYSEWSSSQPNLAWSMNWDCLPMPIAPPTW